MFFRKATAFSLLEVIIGTALLGVLLGFSWTILPRSILVTKHTLLKDYALLLAAEELSRFRALPADEVRAGVVRRESVTGPEDCRFDIACEAYQVDGFSLSELRRARVSVAWRYQRQALLVREQVECCGMAF